MHHAYKANAQAALTVASSIADPQRKIESIFRVASPSRRLGDKFSPRQVVLRVCGYSPVGEPWSLSVGGPASMSTVEVRRFIHRPSGQVVQVAV